MPQSFLAEEVRLNRTEATSVADQLLAVVDIVAGTLPTNGTIRHFRYQNPLKAFERFPFHAGVRKATQLFPATPRYSWQQWLNMIADTDSLSDSTSQNIPLGAISWRDIEDVLRRKLGVGAYSRLSSGLSRIELQMGTLRASRDQHTNGRLSVARDPVGHPNLQPFRRIYGDVESASTEAEPLHQPSERQRLRDLLLSATAIDTDEMVHAVLIPFLARFLDQGQAQWGLPDRECGLLRQFRRLYAGSGGDRFPFFTPAWLLPLREELDRLEQNGWSMAGSIEESLLQLRSMVARLQSSTETSAATPSAAQPDVSESECDKCHSVGVLQSMLSATMMALPGWVAMVYHLQQGGEWLNWSVPHGTLHELVALRLLLDRLAGQYVLHQTQTSRVQQRTINSRQKPAVTLTSDLLSAARAFGPDAQTCCLLDAYDLGHINQVLDALTAGDQERPADGRSSGPQIQVICCADSCQESLRRHLEEVNNRCETFGTPGFFGLAINYRGLGESHYSQHCPANVRSQHYVEEVPGFQQDGSLSPHPRHLNQRPGKSALRSIELSSLLENWLSRPWLTQLLFPRITRRLDRNPSGSVRESMAAQLDWEGPPRANRLQGYTVDEMADAVHHLLTSIGLSSFAPVVLLIGHVSVSPGNSFVAADCCTFCSGRSSGPNARIMARMANDHRVRRILKREGLEIPDSTVFVAAEHDTCSDTIEYFDLAHLSLIQQQHLPELFQCLDQALIRNAHERCRRFTNIPLNTSPEAAAEAMETRGEDLCEQTAEFSYVDNCVCIIGRRERTRGLFLDRTAHLASYDPLADDADGSQLSQLLKTVVPTCASVNLQYYFSTMYPNAFGAGSKLQHSVVSLLGVCDGPGHDLRIGLPEEMLSKVPPHRLLCVVECYPEKLRAVMSQNEPLLRLITNEWIHMACLDPDSGEALLWTKDRFVPHFSHERRLPEVDQSSGWYSGRRDRLKIARIRSAMPGKRPSEQE